MLHYLAEFLLLVALWGIQPVYSKFIVIRGSPSLSSGDINMYVYYYTYRISCEILALWENFIDRPQRAMIRSVLKVVSCFLCAEKRVRFGVYFTIPIHNLTKARYQQILKTFFYYSRTITQLTDIWYRPEQLWESRTSIFCLSFAIFEIPMFGHMTKEVKLWKVSDGTKVVRKCHKTFLIPCFGSGCIWE
jgi:hypothetical protein